MTEKNKNEHRTVLENQSLEEQAINHAETKGKQINHQQKQRSEQHQPRDNA